MNQLKSISSVVIPNTAISILPNAFTDFKNLENIKMSNSINTIGTDAFTGCQNISFVSINILDWANVNAIASVKACSNALFTYFYNDNEVCGDYMIPDGVESIGKQALYNCNTLTTLRFPTSVNKIELNAFTSCENLTDVYAPWETPIKITAKSVFPQKSNGTILANLYVPEGTLDLYQSANFWKKFQNIQEYDATGIDGLSIKNEPDEIFNLQGQKVTSAKAGQIYIKNGKKVLMK